MGLTKRSFIFLMLLAGLLTACGEVPVARAEAAPTVTVDANSPQPFSASLAEVVGQVLARQATEPQFTPAQDGYQLASLGQVQTESQSTVRLDFPNGTLTRLGPNTLFTLQAVEAQPEGLLIQIKLELGRLWVVLNGGSLEVETQSGVAAVRGSYLSVSYDPASGIVKITCLEGQCSLKTDGGTVEITAGQTALAEGLGQPPQPGLMDEKDVQEWLANSPEASLVPLPLILTPEVAPTAMTPTLTPAVTPTLFPPLGGGFSLPSPTPVKEKPEPFPTPFPTPAPSLVSTVTISSVSPVSTLVVAEPLTVTTQVMPDASGLPPTGLVKILAGSYVVCSSSIVATGTATCSGGLPNVGTYALRADYSGDANYLPAQSALWSGVQVDKGFSSTTIQSVPPNPALVGSPVSFTATVDNLYAPLGMPTGSVVFSAGSDTCTVTSAPWTCQMVFTSTGAKTVQADYSGDGNFYSSYSSTVNYQVLGSADTQFSSPSGPDGITVTTSAECSQTYSVEVLDVNGVNQVKVLYSDNPTFPTFQYFLLGQSGNTWGGTNIIPIAAAGGNTAYWRFAVLDGAGNWFYYGGGVPYANMGDNNAYTYLSNVDCP